MHRKNTNAGFTIIELMLAMVFVAFILVFMSLTLVQMFRTYDKGSSMKQVNQAGRSVIEDISRAVRSQLPNDINTQNIAAGVLCINNTMYQWNPLYVGNDLNTDPNRFMSVIGHPVTGGMMARKTLVNPTGPQGCSPNAPVSDESVLLSGRARVLKAEVTRSGDNNRLVKFTFVIGTYASNEFTPTLQPASERYVTPVLQSDGNFTCQPGNNGNYCAFAEFNTIVYISKE